MAGNDRVHIAEFRRLREIDPSHWDAVAGDNILALHGWLRTLEETSRASKRNRYWILRDGGTILAILPASLDDGTEDPNTLDRHLLARITPVARLLGIAPGPALVCGPGFGPDTPLLLRPGLAPGPRKTAAHALLRAVEKEADANGWTICLRGVSPHAGLVRAALEPRRYRQSIEWPSMTLDVRWRSFEEFQKALKHRHKATEKNLRYRTNQLRKAGIEIETLDDPAPQAPTLHQLLDRHYQRKNGMPFPFGVDFLTNLKRHLGARAQVRVARRDSRVLGVSVGLCTGDTMAMKAVGIDEHHPLSAATYHALAYYRPIREAAEEGICQLHLGTHAYDPKVRMGSRLVDSSLFIRTRTPAQDLLLRAVLPLRSRRIKEQVDPFRAVAARTNSGT